MKTLVIVGIILGVFTVYFVLNAEKSISIKGGGNAIPAGTDVAKFILNKVKIIDPQKIISSIIGGNKLKNEENNLLQSDITGEIKSKVGEAKNKILDEVIDLIKKPIENKVSEMFCPQM